MRDQYAGDISDLHKFAFLRAVVPEDACLGVAWYYLAGHDGRSDGQHTEHMEEQKWRGLDVQVHSSLTQLPVRSVASLEEMPFWSDDTIFHRDEVPAREERRRPWAEHMVQMLNPTDVVFVDPDNGLGNTKKHATVAEVVKLSENNRPVVLIKFPHRNAKHPQQLADLHSSFAGRAMTTVRMTVSIAGKGPHFTWFSILNPTEEMNNSVVEFVQRLNRNARASATIHGSEFLGG